MILHETGEGGRESLAADDDVPAHHEDTHQHQQGADQRPPDRQPRSQEDDEGDEVSQPVLKNEDLEKVPLVDDAAEDVP